jgi:glycosyltransferase involved in cell wall biosynthesis
MQDRRRKLLLVGGPDVDARLPLMRQLSRRYDVAAAGSSQHAMSRVGQAGFECFDFPLVRRVNPLADVRSVNRLTAVMRKHRPDIVHTFDTKPGVYGCIAARRAGVPNVLTTITGLGSLYSRNDLRSTLLRRVYAGLQRIACRRADWTVFQNNRDRRQLIAEGVVSPERSLVVLGSGVDTDHYSAKQVKPAERNRLRRQVGLDEEEVVVTMIGRVTRSKGVLTFARAARLVRGSMPNVRFMLIGGEDKESLDRLQPGELETIRTSVHWIGPREDVVELLALSDVFVLPTAYREGIPRVLLEAAAMGLPLVASDMPGCDEVVAHDKNGLLLGHVSATDIAAAVVCLVRNEAARIRMGLESRRRAVRMFDLRVVSDQLDGLYQALLERMTGSSPVLNSMSR